MDFLKKLDELQNNLLKIEENFGKIKSENEFLRKEIKKLYNEIEKLVKENKVLRSEVDRKDKEREEVKKRIENVIFKLDKLEE